MLDEEDDDQEEQTFAGEFWNNLGTGGKPVQLNDLARLAMQRPITPEDIYYLLGQYAYLDICNIDAPALPEMEHPFTTHTSPSGWLIQDRGDRLTAGIGRFSYGAYGNIAKQLKQLIEDDDEESEQGGDEGVGSIKPNGTIIQQCFDTASFMIDLVKQRWIGAEILGGYRPMQRAAWIAAKHSGFLINYGPSASDQQIYDTLVKRINLSNKGFTPK